MRTVVRNGDLPDAGRSKANASIDSAQAGVQPIPAHRSLGADELLPRSVFVQRPRTGQA